MSPKSTISVAIFFLWTRWAFLVHAYSHSDSGLSGRGVSNPPRTKAKEKLNQQQMVEPTYELDQWKRSSRRVFMTQVMGIFSVAPAAMAIDSFSSNSKSSNTMSGYGSGSITPSGTVAVSKKVGGLANKIRGICLHMVRMRTVCLFFFPRVSNLESGTNTRFIFQ